MAVTAASCYKACPVLRAAHTDSAQARPVQQRGGSPRNRCSARPLCLSTMMVGSTASTLQDHSSSFGRRINVFQLCALQCTGSALPPSLLAVLESSGDVVQDVCLSKRQWLLLAALAATTALPASAADGLEQQQAGSAGSSTRVYQDTGRSYSLAVPLSWERIDKAGADALFEDPTKRSTSIGVTVNPVRVKSIEQFGGLEAVGSKLLEAEKAKESTLSVALLRQEKRAGAAGATLYDYEYELESTRGRKRILNTVTIFGSRLFIVNAAVKCGKEVCAQDAVGEDLARLRQAVASFDVL